MAQEELTRDSTKEVESAELIDRIIRLFDAEKRREAQRLARQALAS